MPGYIRFFKHPLVAVACLLLVASIRFNRNELIFSRPLNDAAFYIANVEKMRGISPTTYAYKGPFNERVLGTTIAAFLPFSPHTAINVTNLLFLIGAVYFLFRLLRDSGISENLSWTGVYIFIFSFPTFFYSTIGYIDPTVLTAIFCGTWALFSGKHILFVIAITAGALSKENIVILIPIALAYAYRQRELKWAFTAAIGGIIILTVNSLLRDFHAGINDYVVFWEPHWYRITHNLTRPNFYISTILTWGVPLLICAWYGFRYPGEIRKTLKDDLPVLIGIICILGTTCYMVIAAFPDGRNVWVGYCFPVLLAMKWWQRFGSPFRHRKSSLKT